MGFGDTGKFLSWAAFTSKQEMKMKGCDLRKKVATPPAYYRSLSGPSGPKCPGSVPGVSLGVGVFGALRVPGSGVSKKCQKVSGHSGNTLGTRSGHFLDTRARRAPETPGAHSQDTSSPNTPRDSCSRAGGLRRKGGFGKGGFCRAQVTPKDTKIPRYWAQQYIRHSQRHGQERRTSLQTPPSKKFL